MGMNEKLPTSIEDINSAWLTAALQRSGRLRAGETVTVVDAKPLSSGASFSTRMYRMQLDGPGLPASAIIKLPVTGPVRQLIDAGGSYVREVTFYRELAADTPLRVPEAYVAEFEQDTGNMVLLIEDLAPLTPNDQLVGLTLQQAEAAIDDLARFHASSWEQPHLPQYADRLLPLDSAKGRAIFEQFGRFFAMTWPTALRVEGAGLSDKVCEFGQRLPALIPFFLGQLATPRAIIHGELRSENLFFDTDGSLILIDFQIVGQGSGVFDVSYLLSQSLTIEVRRGNDERLMRRYWQGLVNAGVQNFPWEQAWKQYRLGVAFNLIMPGVAFMTYENTTERGRALLLQMLSRASAAIEDNASLDLLSGAENDPAHQMVSRVNRRNHVNKT